LQEGEIKVSEKKTGGPAFPCDVGVARAWSVFENAKKPLSDADYEALINQLQQGMSLRDYYAGKAMDGICSHPETWGLNVEQIAATAFEMADAMLKAREA
jgi:hypothetical protein